MSLIGAILNAAPTKTPVPMVGRSQGGLFGAFTRQAGTTQQLSAMEASGTVFNIVDRIATAVSLVNWQLWRKAKSGKAEDRTEITSHLALDVWNRPNDFMTRQELVEVEQQHQELTGEGWTVVGYDPRASKIPLELWPVRPDRMEPVPSHDAYLLGYTYRSFDGEMVPLERKDVLFMRRPDPNNPYRGLGPIKPILVDIDSSRAAAEWNRSFFANSAEPGGIVEVEKRLSDDEFDELTRRWAEQHQGVSRAHSVAILENGVKWVDRKYTMRDMEFTELRGVTASALREAFGFPKFMAGLVDDVNRANAEASEAMFAQWLVVPRLERWKAMLNFEFLPLFGATADGLEFDYIDPVPENSEAENTARTSKVGAVSLLVPLGFDAKESLKAFGLPDIPWTKPEPPAPAPGAGFPPGQKPPQKKQDPLQALLITPIFDFDPNQLRDRKGRWAKGSGAHAVPLTDKELATARAVIDGFRPKKFDSPREALGYLKDISPKLPVAQRRAAERYSGEGLNFEVNEALASGDLSRTGLQRDVGLLRDAARPIPDDVVLTRTFNKEHFERLGWGSLDDIEGLKGQKVTHAAFSSTALGLTYGGGWTDITMKIAAPAGTRGIVMPNHSLNPTENEIVLVDGMDFAVSSVQPNGLGGYVISMIVIPPTVNNSLHTSSLRNQAPTDDPDLARVQADWEAALERLLADWRQVTHAQRAEIRAQVRDAVAAGDMTALANLRLSHVDGAAVLTAALIALALVSSRRMAAELTAQGAPPIEPPPPDESALGQVGVAAALLLAGGLAGLAAGAAVAAFRFRPAVPGSRRPLPGMPDTPVSPAGPPAVPVQSSPDEVVAAVDAALDERSDRALRDALGGALTTGQNQARLLTAQAVEQEIERMELLLLVTYIATEKNDSSTCWSCLNVDGTQYASWIDAWIDYGGGKYRGCEGRNRCRGTIVARVTEVGTLPQVPGAPTPDDDDLSQYLIQEDEKPAVVQIGVGR